MITKTQGVCLVGVRDTPVVLSHNERTSDEHGNACVQEGLTSLFEGRFVWMMSSSKLQCLCPRRFDIAVGLLRPGQD
jgi:hypothetical protein